MSRSTVTLAKNVNIGKLKFSERKTLTNGSSTVYVNYEGGKLHIQTPIMRLPYGIGDWNEKNNEGKKAEDAVKKYDISISFSDIDTNPKMKALHDKMREIEKRIIDEATAKSMSWLDDDLERAVVAKFFWPIIQVSKDKVSKKPDNKYPPTMKIKLPYDNRNDLFSFDAQDMDGEALDFKSIMTSLKDARGRFIIELSGIWMAGGRFGCSWKVIRGMFEISAKREMPKFIVDSDDDADNAAADDEEDDEDLAEDLDDVHIAAPAVVASPPASAPVVADEEADDAEGEEADGEGDEDEDSEEDEPPPPPPPVKKAGKKVAAKK